MEKKMPFLIRGDDGSEFGNKYIVIITDVWFYQKDEWGQQKHFQQDHKDYFDKDIGVSPHIAVPEEEDLHAKKHVFDTEEEVREFMKKWWNKNV